MRIARRLTAAGVFAGIAVLSASPAWADDTLNGTYDVIATSGPVTTWVITPCGSGCSHVAESDDWSADATFANGPWLWSVDAPDGALCPDGSRAPDTEHYSVDAASLTGTVRTTLGPGTCGLAAPQATPEPLTLTKTG